METTRLSTRGQIVLPLSIRTARGLTPGTDSGLRYGEACAAAVRSLPETSLEDLAVA